MAAILATSALTKYFRNSWNWRRSAAVRDLDLRIEAGEIFGLIGPNGAGKTTTFKLLLGLLRPSAGTIVFQGQPLDTAARAVIGFLPEQSYFYDYLTVREILEFYAALYGLPLRHRRARVDQVMELVRVSSQARASLRTLSKGTLQRVGVAQAILNRPRLVILDEPMSGLDPAGRRQMRELIQTLQQEGTTVIFSSHILPDAEALCTRVGILAGGRLREVVNLHGEQEPRAYVMTVTNLDADGLRHLEAIAETSPSQNGRHWHVRLPDHEALRAALRVVAGGSAVVHSVNPVDRSLEERFLTHVGPTTSLD